MLVEWSASRILDGVCSVECNALMKLKAMFYKSVTRNPSMTPVYLNSNYSDEVCVTMMPPFSAPLMTISNRKTCITCFENNWLIVTGNYISSSFAYSHIDQLSCTKGGLPNNGHQHQAHVDLHSAGWTRCGLGRERDELDAFNIVRFVKCRFVGIGNIFFTDVQKLGIISKNTMPYWRDFLKVKSGVGWFWLGVVKIYE